MLLSILLFPCCFVVAIMASLLFLEHAWHAPDLGRTLALAGSSWKALFRDICMLSFLLPSIKSLLRYQLLNEAHPLPLYLTLKGPARLTPLTQVFSHSPFHLTYYVIHLFLMSVFSHHSQVPLVAEIFVCFLFTLIPYT